MKGAGGSISGQLFNNKETPLPVREQGSGTRAATNYQGNVKSPYSKPGKAEGTEYGNFKFIAGYKPSKAKRYGGYIQSTKIPFIKNPDKQAKINYGNVKSVVGYKPSQAKKYGGYIKTTSIPFIKKSSRPEGTKYGNMKSLFFYTPGKAKNYGGYVSSKPFKSRKQMHPSFNYRDNGENSAEEKNKVFKFRIWWASLFGKNGNQPKNLKEGEKRPRYDKRESGLWYE